MKKKPLQKKAKKNYEKISPTAVIVAHFRTFSDIPFSKDIFEEIKRKKVGQMDISYIPDSRAVLFEARHKIVDHLIKKAHFKQVLEISAGYSPRGLDMTSNPNFTYVETDLPAILSEKRKMAKKILTKHNFKRLNLRFVEANALDREKVMKTMRYFSKDGIAVVSEGLVRYLNHAEKIKLANNVKELLGKKGGIWIVPDIEVRQKLLNNPSYQNSTKKISKETGTDIRRNMFSDVADAKKFFEKLGFMVAAHNLQEVEKKLYSPGKLHITAKETKERIGILVPFVLKLKK
ncbi:MAG TPA: class I SAM-dependent methyltransferase [Candidatus Bathyarchaeia archaeon]|nr:class I SAM-dependent methyltransferase [Candidatus Bathyarchaeia archaeon]